MTAAEARRLATQLGEQGNWHGPKWGQIIAALGGHDPRYRGSTGQMSLYFNPAQHPNNQPAAAPPAPAPAAPAPPPMPGRIYDSAYTAETAGFGNALTQGLADIDTNRSRLGWTSGYTVAGEIDTRNPYSQAMALQRHWQQSRRGTHNSMAARGQLYSTARDRGLANDDYNYDSSSSNLKTQTQWGYQDLSTAEQNLNALYGPGGSAWVGAQANQAGRWQDQEREWHSLYG